MSSRRFGRRTQAAARYVIARDRGICGLCGHTGATTWGHIIAVDTRKDLEWDSSNWQAQHGPKAGRPGGCTVNGCDCPGNYGIGKREYKRRPSRNW